MNGTLRRIAIGVATGALAVVALALPVSADVSGHDPGGPILIVQNPSPGDVIPRSKQYWFGIAYDPAAKSGIGVDRVMVYAGDRDAGGYWLGTAVSKADAAKFKDVDPFTTPSLIRGTLGLLNPAAIGTQWANSRWSIKTQTLHKTQSGSIFFYARSSVSSKETVVRIDNISIDPGRNLSVSKP